ncbi:MAG: MutL protein, partial [Firmicutes bacterium]|nr:MutL protein [Bacillota bacterium]
GTDGGNSANILHNARVLASLPEGVPVVLAGNRAAAAAVRGCFPQNFSIYTASNVMPQIGKLDVEPAREVIRQVFMEKIIYAKGLARAGGLIEGIFMPTPAAVLRAGRLLSQGSPPLPGWGDLLIVDVGGATTDVHSLGLGLPTKTGVVLRGLPEPLAKRTVEGDLGVRVSVLSLVESIGRERLQKELGLREEELHKLVQRLDQQPESLPQTEIERLFDRALGFHAIRIGVSRHAGTLTESYTPSGQVWIQEGKDLSQVNIIIGTGGVLVNSKEPHAMLRGAQKESNSSLELKPEKPRYFLDANYLLASAGLLSTVYPEAALEILENSLKADELRRRGF